MKTWLIDTGPLVAYLDAGDDAHDDVAEFAVASGTEIYDLCQPLEIRAAARLMKKYADTPMDFADATLVLLAEALGVRKILTLDRRGFRVFRDRRNRAFDLVLSRGR